MYYVGKHLFAYMYILIYSGTYYIPCLRTYELHEFDRVECDENMHENFFPFCRRVSSELTMNSFEWVLGAFDALSVVMVIEICTVGT
jgi:hypothetical protein